MILFLRMSFTVIEWKALSVKPMQCTVMFSFCRMSSMCRFWLLQLEPDQESSYNISTKSIEALIDLTLLSDVSDANRICFWPLWQHLKVDTVFHVEKLREIPLPYKQMSIYQKSRKRNLKMPSWNCLSGRHVMTCSCLFLHVLDILILWRWSPNVLHHRRVSRLEALRRVFGEAAEVHQFGQVSAT